MITVTVKNAAKIENDFKRWPEKSTAVYTKAVNEASAKFRDMTKSLPPVSASRTGWDAKGIPVDTGDLRGRINYRKVAGIAAGLFSAAAHGVPVHEGTPTMKARPYFQWALELGAQKAIDAIFARASKLLP